MEGLFIENFIKQYKHGSTTEKITVQNPLNTLDLSIPQDNNQKFDRKNSDLLLEMSICLDRLEKEIQNGYPDFADYRFIFNKIRASFKQNNVDGVNGLLDDLEELLDLGIASLIIQKNIN